MSLRNYFFNRDNPTRKEHISETIGQIHNLTPNQIRQVAKENERDHVRVGRSIGTEDPLAKIRFYKSKEKYLAHLRQILEEGGFLEDGDLVSAGGHNTAAQYLLVTCKIPLPDMNGYSVFVDEGLGDLLHNIQPENTILFDAVKQM